MTQQDLYRAVGMSKSTYLSREWGERPWTVVEIEAIADIFDMTASELVAAAEERPDDNGDHPWMAALGGE